MGCTLSQVCVGVGWGGQANNQQHIYSYADNGAQFSYDVIRRNVKRLQTFTSTRRKWRGTSKPCGILWRSGLLPEVSACRGSARAVAGFGKLGLRRVQIIAGSMQTPKSLRTP